MIFSTQGSNSGLLRCWRILYHLRHQGSPVSHNLNIWKSCPWLKTESLTLWIKQRNITYTKLKDRKAVILFQDISIECLPPVRHYMLGQEWRIDTMKLPTLLWLTFQLKGSGRQCWTSLLAQLVKNLRAVHETWVQSLGQEDPLKKENSMNRLAWQAPVHGVTRIRHNFSNQTTITKNKSKNSE